MKNSNQDLMSLKRRFVDDLKFPVTVFEDGYWEFYLGLYEKEFHIKTLWNKLLKGIEEEYEGSIQSFLSDFYKMREEIITSIKTSEGYKQFNNENMEERFGIKNLPFFGVKKSDIYNEGSVNSWYISLDLKKANFQALNYYDRNIFTDKELGEQDLDTYYTNWINSFIEGKQTLSWYAPTSKYLRQVIFGNCNPSRQITVERYLIGNFCNKLLESNILKGKKVEVIEFGADEIVLKLENIDGWDEEGFQGQIRSLCDAMGITVKAKVFFLTSIEFKTPNDHTIRVYKKQFNTGDFEYKAINRFWYAQVYELLNNIQPDPEDRDLVFYQEKEVAKFVGRIKLV